MVEKDNAKKPRVQTKSQAATPINSLTELKQLFESNSLKNLEQDKSISEKDVKDAIKLLEQLEKMNKQVEKLQENAKTFSFKNNLK